MSISRAASNALDELPNNQLVVSYCRGVYCLLSNDAEALLREKGFDVSRLEAGWPECWDEGRARAAE